MRFQYKARQIYLHGCRLLGEVAPSLSVECAGSQGILLANDLAGQSVALAEETPIQAIIKT